jgi:two-component sensor histidine kinase/ligand-binding sensor domain-containing protein
MKTVLSFSIRTKLFVTPFKVIIFIMTLLSQDISAQKLPITTFDFTGTEIEGESITCIFVDKDGYFWLGGYSAGLIRWDGKNAEIFVEDLPLFITEIWQDTKGYLWFSARSNAATGEGLYVSSRPVGNDYVTDSLEFSQDHFGVKLLDKFTVPYGGRIEDDGSLLVSAKVNDLVKYRYTSDTTLLADTIISIPGTAKEGAIHGNIPLGDDKYMYTYFKNKDFVIQHENIGLENENVDTINLKGLFYSRLFFADSLGGVWGGNTKELFYITPERRIERKKIPAGIKFLVKIRNDYFIGANDQGLLEIDISNKTATNWKIKSYSSKNGLPSSRILHLKYFKDKIWIGHEGGFSCLPQDFKAFKKFDNETVFKIKEKGITSLIPKVNFGIGDSLLVLASNNGVELIHSSSNESIVLNTESGLLTNSITSLETDSENRIWILDGNTGSINCLFPKGEKPIFFENATSIKLFGIDYGLATHKDMFVYFFYDQIKSKIYDSVYSDLLIGINNSHIYLISEAKEILHLTIENGFESTNTFGYVLIDELGYMYATSDKGLFKSTIPWTIENLKNRIKQSEIDKIRNHFYLTKGTLFQKYQVTFERDTFTHFKGMLEIENNLWLSVEKGILIYSKEKNKVERLIKSPDKLGIIKESKDYVIAPTKIGFLLIDKQNFKIKHSVSQKDGLHATTVATHNGFKIDENDVSYLTTPNSLTTYDYKLDNTETPKNLHCKVRAFEFEEDLFGDNKLSISYVSFNDFATDNPIYQTRLKGLSEEWSNTTTSNNMEYMNLKAFFIPKNYEFEFKAQDYKGDWHQLKEPLTIKVTPPIWFRWWAFLIYAFFIYLLIKYLLKRQEENLRKSLLLEEAEKIKEKNIIIQEKNDQNELLLKEIHHRVKNNLQTISSLLFLQSASISDKDAKDALKAVQQRVESMALIHKKLYEETNLSQIEMKGYVKLLVSNLVDSFNLTNKVEVNYEVDDLKMEMDQAIPIGLLITELVTNSLKYAFIGKEKGILNVHLKQSDKLIQLFVKDNGNGKIADAKDSFGSKLIKMLSRQLEAKLSSGNQDGYWTNIEFEREWVKN